MGCLGVHFAVTDEEVGLLHAFRDEQDRLNYLTEEIETNYFENHPEWLVSSDKSWDAMHRALADGQLTWTGGEYPFNHVILAGEILYTQSDYIVTLKTAQQVRDVAAAIGGMTETEFRKRYFAIGPGYDGELSEEDFLYTWENFQEVCDFFQRASADGRQVLFTADQ